MMAKLKRFDLARATVVAIAQHAEIRPVATSEAVGSDSPITRPGPQLPQAIVDTLKAALKDDVLSGGRQSVVVGADDATTLATWLRILADRLGMVAGAEFREAAERIEHTETAS
jgi:hypothetical protein